MMLRALALLSLLGLADAWGPDGHTIIAHIAETMLTPEVNASMWEILGETTLNNASDWCDDFDHSDEGRWSEPLHFTNYPGESCSFNWDRDCQKDWCNAGAIVNFTKQLADTSLSLSTRFIALKFVIHMMGDVHQPLHVASGDDRGGNTIELAGNQFAPTPAPLRSQNLHAEWDSDLLVEDIEETKAYAARAGKPFPVHYHNWQILAAELEKRMASGGEWSGNVTEWQAPLSAANVDSSIRAGLALVANGTAKNGCVYAYSWANGTRIQAGEILPRSYYLRAKPIIEEQLAKGGARLAQLLNVALAKPKPSLLVV